MMFKNPSSDSVKASTDLRESFKRIAEEISEYGALYGVKIIPYRDPNLTHFMKLNFKKQQKVLAHLEHQKNFFAMAQAEGLHPNSPKLIWRMLSQMGMTPQNDIFDKIEIDDTVEIYHWDSTSSFKNLKFFEFISHSIEELYTLTWMEQWSLSFRMYMFFLEINSKVKLAKIKHTFAPKFNRYILSEKMGEKRVFDIHLKWASPVTYEGKQRAVLFVNKSSFADLKKK